MGSTMRIPPAFVLQSGTLENFRYLFSGFPVIRWIMNSLIVSTSITLIRIFTSCLAGYAFAKKEFPAKSILFWTLLCTMMLPYHITLVPLYIIVRNLGLYNSYPGIFLPVACSVGSMFLARQYMTTIPSELIDFARIDGASELRIFLSVIMPISKPLIAVLCIFGFIGSWGDFLWPLIMTSSNSMRTLAVGIVGAAARPGQFTQNVGIAMAGACLVAVPIIIVFLCFQKYFIKGITLGAIKG